MPAEGLAIRTPLPSANGKLLQGSLRTGLSACVLPRGGALVGSHSPRSGVGPNWRGSTAGDVPVKWGSPHSVSSGPQVASHGGAPTSGARRRVPEADHDNSLARFSKRPLARAWQWVPAEEALGLPGNGGAARADGVGGRVLLRASVTAQS